MADKREKHYVIEFKNLRVKLFFGREENMKKILLTTALATTIFLNCNSCFAHNSENLSAQDALSKLKEGNERFVKYHQKHPDENKKRRILEAENTIAYAKITRKECAKKELFKNIFAYTINVIIDIENT